MQHWYEECLRKVGQYQSTDLLISLIVMTLEIRCLLMWNQLGSRFLQVGEWQSSQQSGASFLVLPHHVQPGLSFCWLGSRPVALWWVITACTQTCSSTGRSMVSLHPIFRTWVAEMFCPVAFSHQCLIHLPSVPLLNATPSFVTKNMFFAFLCKMRPDILDVCL